MDDNLTTYLDAAGAAAAVGVSTSGLRRLAPSYEAVYGPLPRAGKGSGDSPRLWSTVAVRRLAAARQAVEAGQHKSVRTALEALQGHENTGDGLEADLRGAQLTDRQLLEAVLSELSVLRAELAEVKQLPTSTPAGGTDDDRERHGLIVRFALWLERVIYKR